MSRRILLLVALVIYLTLLGFSLAHVGEAGASGRMYLFGLTNAPASALTAGGSLLQSFLLILFLLNVGVIGWQIVERRASRFLLDVAAVVMAVQSLLAALVSFVLLELPLQPQAPGWFALLLFDALLLVSWALHRRRVI